MMMTIVSTKTAPVAVTRARPSNRKPRLAIRTHATSDDDAKVGYSTDGASKPAGPKGGRGTATSGDDSAGDKKTKANVLFTWKASG